MTPEELMSPRYKVILDYPGSLYKINQIVYESENLQGATFFKITVHKYPYIFKPIAWYVERLKKHMPTYVKVQDSLLGQYPQFIMIDKWVMDKIVPILHFGNDNLTAWYTEPATEQQYIDYINSIK